MSQDVREEPARGIEPPATAGGPVGSGPEVIEESPKTTVGVQTSQSAKTGVPLRPLATPMKSAKASGLQKAVGFVRFVAPVVQKVLPLLEGNVAMAVSNLLAPRQQGPRVDLAPIESAVMKMRKDHVDLRLSVADQTAALKRIAEQVEAVKAVSECNGVETRELTRDVEQLRRRVSVFAWVGIGLLVLSIVVNIVLFVQIRHLAH